MNVIVIHRKSMTIDNIINVDSITVSSGNVVIHGNLTTNPNVLGNYTYANADYMVRIMDN